MNVMYIELRLCVHWLRQYILGFSNVQSKSHKKKNPGTICEILFLLISVRRALYNNRPVNV